MNGRMNKALRNWLILIIVIAVAIVALLLATSSFWLLTYPFGPRPRPPFDIRGDIELYYTVETVVSTVNVTLSIFLLLIYANIYRKTRSEFTVGLTIFSAVFMLNAVASNPLVRAAFGYRPFGLGIFTALPDIFTLGALLVLLYLSVKY